MQEQEPGEVFSAKTPRVSAAIRLHRRRERDTTGLFLAEGQAAAEAIRAGVVRELFVTAGYAVQQVGPRVSVVSQAAMQALSDTVTPQGVVAVCEQRAVPLDDVLAGKPKLLAVVVEIRDPGNAGTILRTADAAGADAVIFAGDAVDPYNGKCVRAGAGSIFHLPLVRERNPHTVVTKLRLAGLLTLATTGRAENDIFAVEPRLAQPTAWLFGGEAHGLPGEVLAGAEQVRIPIFGAAESLNLAAAAAVCLYASARAQRD